MGNGYRTCIGCRRVAPRAELIRVVATAAGELRFGKGMPGRGAWLCLADGLGIKPKCFEAAKAKRAFERALRKPLLLESVDELHSP